MPPKRARGCKLALLLSLLEGLEMPLTFLSLGTAAGGRDLWRAWLGRAARRDWGDVVSATVDRGYIRGAASLPVTGHSRQAIVSVQRLPQMPWQQLTTT